MNSSRARMARAVLQRRGQGQHAHRRHRHVALHEQQPLVRRLGGEDPLPEAAPVTAIADTSGSADVTPRCSNRSAAQMSRGTVG